MATNKLEFWHILAQREYLLGNLGLAANALEKMAEEADRQGNAEVARNARNDAGILELEIIRGE